MNANEYAQHRRGLLMVVISTFAWSTAGFFTRLIQLDAWTILFWRGILSTLFIAVYAVWHFRRDTLRVFRSVGWGGYIFAALSALAMSSFVAAVKMTTVANVAIIYATVPFLAAAIGWVWLREKISVSTAITSLVAFGGIAVMLSESTFSRTSPWGDFLALITTFASAGMIVMIRRYHSIPIIPAVCLANLLTGLFALPFATPLAIESEHLFYLALFAFLPTGLGFTLFTIGSRLIPAIQTALISSLETPLGPLWVWLVFREAPSTHAIAGGAIVMAAVLGHVALENRRRLASTAISLSTH